VMRGSPWRCSALGGGNPLRIAAAVGHNRQPWTPPLSAATCCSATGYGDSDTRTRLSALSFRNSWSAMLCLCARSACERRSPLPSQRTMPEFRPCPSCLWHRCCRLGPEHPARFELFAQLQLNQGCNRSCKPTGLTPHRIAGLDRCRCPSLSASSPRVDRVPS